MPFRMKVVPVSEDVPEVVDAMVALPRMRPAPSGETEDGEVGVMVEKVGGEDW